MPLFLTTWFVGMTPLRSSTYNLKLAFFLKKKSFLYLRHSITQSNEAGAPGQAHSGVDEQLTLLRAAFF